MESIEFVRFLISNRRKMREVTGLVGASLSADPELRSEVSLQASPDYVKGTSWGAGLYTQCFNINPTWVDSARDNAMRTHLFLSDDREYVVRGSDMALVFPLSTPPSEVAVALVAAIRSEWEKEWKSEPQAPWWLEDEATEDE